MRADLALDVIGYTCWCRKYIRVQLYYLYNPRQANIRVYLTQLRAPEEQAQVQAMEVVLTVGSIKIPLTPRKECNST